MPQQVDNLTNGGLGKLGKLWVGYAWVYLDQDSFEYNFLSCSEHPRRKRERE